jgi:hypothetical protein
VSLLYNNARLSVPLILSLNAAVIGWVVAQSEIPAVGFVHKYEHVFAFKSVILRLLFPIKVNCVQSDIPRALRLRRSKVQLRGLYGEVCYIPASRTPSAARYID